MSSEKTTRRQLVEIGWIVAGSMPARLERSLEEAKERYLETLAGIFPDFTWQVNITHRRKLVQLAPVQPVRLLESAVRERDFNHWDFAMVFTSAEMIGSSRTHIFGAISRALDSGVIALRPIDPMENNSDNSESDSGDLLARRISALAMHFLGHFVGLDHEKDSKDFMAEVSTPETLDVMSRLSDESLPLARQGIAIVADQRLEEDTRSTRYSRFFFYLKGTVINRRDIFDAVVKAKPWLFPVHLSRLTTAAMSTAMIMIVTTEVWEIAHNLNVANSTGLSCAVVIVTTIFVMTKQKLILPGKPGRSTEQQVTTNVATAIVVLLGMITTYALLFLTAVTMAAALFSEPLIDRWVGRPEMNIHMHYLLLGSFVGSVGLAIGSLGASFESQEYFRHVTYVDEEF